MCNVMLLNKEFYYIYRCLIRVKIRIIMFLGFFWIILLILSIFKEIDYKLKKWNFYIFFDSNNNKL